MMERSAWNQSPRLPNPTTATHLIDLGGSVEGGPSVLCLSTSGLSVSGTCGSVASGRTSGTVGDDDL